MKRVGRHHLDTGWRLPAGHCRRMQEFRFLTPMDFFVCHMILPGIRHQLVKIHAPTRVESDMWASSPWMSVPGSATGLPKCTESRSMPRNHEMLTGVGREQLVQPRPCWLKTRFSTSWVLRLPASLPRHPSGGEQYTHTRIHSASSQPWEALSFRPSLSPPFIWLCLAPI